MNNMNNMNTDNNRRVVLWHRNDLRTRDNLALEKAIGLSLAGDDDDDVRSRNIGELLPVFVFDPIFFNKADEEEEEEEEEVTEKKSGKGFNNRGAKGTSARIRIPKCSVKRAEFVLGTVKELKNKYKRLGLDMLIRVGYTEDVLGELNSSFIVAMEEICSDEKEIERKVIKNLEQTQRTKVILVKDGTLFHEDDVNEILYKGKLKERFPDQFTQFRLDIEQKNLLVRKIEVSNNNAFTNDEDVLKKTFAKLMKIDNNTIDFSFEPAIKDLPLSKDALRMHECIPKDSDDNNIRAVITFKAGEEEALKRLEKYLYGTRAIDTYFDTRNGMLNDLDSTKLAPYLAIGAISPRTIEREIRKYEQTVLKNKSTYWVIFELMWRDFYRFFAIKHKNKIFKLDGVGSNGKMPPWLNENDQIEIFQSFITGQTGFPLIDANMRELKATGWMSNRGRQNVASWLALDCRVDWRLGAQWFEFLLLDYDCASNYGNWVAAAGLTRGRVNKFNIQKQTNDYDPEMTYCKKWIPELSSSETANASTYPKPIKLEKFTFLQSQSQSQKPNDRAGGAGAFSGAGGRAKKNANDKNRKQGRDAKNQAFYNQRNDYDRDDHASNIFR